MDRFRRIATVLLRAMRFAWLVVGIVLLLFFALESAARVVSPAAANRDDEWVAEALGSWGADYVKEFRGSYRTHWVPYVQWRREPFEGRYINVDRRGFRRTWNPPVDSRADGRPLEVFMFGGSTMWGTGARDDYTIPSHLSRALNSGSGPRVRVTNYGESGYVSTQEIVALVRELQAGRRPDLVVFYDGFNDTMTAFEEGEAGLPANESHRRKNFHMPKRKMAYRLFREGLKSLRIVQLLGRGPGNVDVKAVDVERLAADVLATYRANMKLVSSLGEQYGFKSLFFWQPNIFTKESLTAAENRWTAKLDRMKPLLVEVADRSREPDALGGDPAAINLVDVFAKETRRCYVDFCHLSERANGVIVERMLPAVTAALKAVETSAKR